jgi:predicted RNase H-like HicB family nuclease
MKFYHVRVEQDEGWFIGHVLERDGITTQGRSLDELLFMVRDAIELMWGEKNVELEMYVPRDALTSYDRKAAKSAKRRLIAKRPFRTAKKRAA